MNFPFLKEETFDLRTQETFIGDSCEIYLPQSFIGTYGDSDPLAIELGSRVMTMGLFWFKVNGQDWYELQLPLKFEFEYSDKYKKRTKVGGRADIPEDDFVVYVLHKGDAFLYDTRHKKDLEDLRTEYIDQLIEKAKLPTYISYSEALNTFLKAMQATDYPGIGISAVSFEFILSEIYRNKNNLKEPFRMAYNGNNPYGYKMVRITKVNELNSTFTGLIGQDIQSQLVSGILRTREGIKDRETPVEKIIKY